MLVVLIVAVGVIVLQHLMLVLVLVALGKMQPEADIHESTRHQQLEGQRLAERRNCQHRANKWHQRLMGPGAGRAEMAKREDEHDQAHADAEEAGPQCRCDRHRRRQCRSDCS